MPIDNDDIQYFKGNQFTCYSGILAWGTTLLMPLIVGLIADDAELAIGLCIILLPVVVLPLSFTFNYFGVASWGIVVRNHNFFWRRKRLYFDDINQVILESPANGKRLIIETKQNKKKTYRGHSLRIEDWLALKQALLARGVKVHDKIGLERQADPVYKKHLRLMYRCFALYAIIATAVSWPISTMEAETTQQMILKAVLMLLLMIAAGYSFIKMWAWLTSKYAEEKKDEQQ